MVEKFKKVDKLFNRFIQKGGNNSFFEYTIKYLITCGLGVQIVFLIAIFN